MDEATKFVYAEQKGVKKGEMQFIHGMHKNEMLIEGIAKFTNLRIVGM